MGARPSGGLERAVATSSASSLPENLHSARPRLFAERGFQVVFDEAALGPVHRRSVDGDADGDVFVAGAGIGRQQDLRPLELARGMLAAARQSAEFVALILAELHSVTYIHRCPPAVEGWSQERLAEEAGVGITALSRQMSIVDFRR